MLPPLPQWPQNIHHTAQSQRGRHRPLQAARAGLHHTQAYTAWAQTRDLLMNYNVIMSVHYYGQVHCTCAKVHVHCTYMHTYSHSILYKRASERGMASHPIPPPISLCYTIDNKVFSLAMLASHPLQFSIVTYM